MRHHARRLPGQLATLRNHLRLLPNDRVLNRWLLKNGVLNALVSRRFPRNWRSLRLLHALVLERLAWEWYFLILNSGDNRSDLGLSVLGLSVWQVLFPAFFCRIFACFRGSATRRILHLRLRADNRLSGPGQRRLPR